MHARLGWGLSVMPLIGIARLLVGVIWRARIAIFAQRASVATGRVESITQLDDSTAWVVTFKFADDAGKVHTPRTEFLSSPKGPSLRPGDRISVLYDPLAPDYASIDSFETMWLYPVFFISVGSFFVIGAAVMLLVMRRIARAQYEQATQSSRNSGTRRTKSA